MHIVCFSADKATKPLLNGVQVSRIFADLHPPSTDGALDLTTAKRLSENEGVSFQGVVPRANVQKKRAKELGLPPATFTLPGDVARKMLCAHGNPNGRPNSDVVVPYLIGQELGKHSRDRFIVDFGLLSEKQAALYETPFSYILPVKAHRAAMMQPEALATWWQHWRTRQEMREALKPLTRYIATSRVAKHRLFVWRAWPTLPDNAVVVIARDDDTTFGIVHSKFHRVWSLRMGTALQNRPRYTSTTTFETFPFPAGLTPKLTTDSYADDERAKLIAAAAKELNQLRENWLHPPSLATQVDDVVDGFPARWVPLDEEAAHELKKRTLVALYNDPPPWLRNAHQELDEAVSRAYGWPANLDHDAILQRLLALNLSRKGGALPPELENEDDDSDEGS